MSNDKWKILKFKDCITQLNTGLNPRKNFSLGHGNLKYITAKNLTMSGDIDFSKCDFIDEDAKAIINRRSDIKIGDILLSSRAPIGSCHLIVEDPKDYDIGESIFSIRVDENIIMPEYLCLYFTSSYFMESAAKNTTGSIIQEIRVNDLMDIDVIVPPKDTQKDIADCLTTINDKIRLNVSQCVELESMAKMIFDYWFLQFDFPDENGKPYKSSGGKMVWNDELKRDIPDGWEVSNFGKYIDVERGISYSSNEIAGGGISMINLNSFNTDSTYKPDGIKSYSGNYSDEKKVSAYDLLMCVTQQTAIDETGVTNVIGKVFLVPDIFETDVVASMDVIKLIVDERLGNCYMRSFINSPYFHKYLTGFANGTKIKHLDVKGLLDFVSYIPNKSLIDKFNAAIMDMECKKSMIIKENQELVSLRDFLLPMLMNGQVTFKN